MMIDAPFLIFAFFTGAVLGAIFFGGLWWTVRRGVSSNQPALWFLGSLVLRMSIALSGFYLVGRGHWERLIACLIGFVLARLAVTWMTRHSGQKQSQPAQEAAHAPES
jgi:F1F0 ATPase subunit 2